MRQMMLLFVLLALLALPMNAAFSQDNGGGLYDCDPATAVNNLLITLTTIQDLPSLQAAVVYVGEYFGTCFETWLQLLPMLLMGGGSDMMMDDFSSEGFGGGLQLAPVDAEVMLRAGINGDLVTANAWLCEKDQISQEEFESLGDVTLDELTCYQDGENITCDTTVTIGAGSTNPITLSDSVTFEVINGQFCSLD